MSYRYRKSTYSFWNLENILILLYFSFFIFLIFTKQINWLAWIFITIIFIFLMIGIKIYRGIYLILIHVIEDLIFKVLYAVGVGKYVVKLIKIISEEEKDMDYQQFRKYMSRKMVFDNVVKRKGQVSLKLDTYSHI